MIIGVGFISRQDELLYNSRVSLRAVHRFSVHQSMDIAFTYEVVGIFTARPYNNWHSSPQEYADKVSLAHAFVGNSQVSLLRDQEPPSADGAVQSPFKSKAVFLGELCIG